MNDEDLVVALEAKGFARFTSPMLDASLVSAALLRRERETDLVLVIDTADPEGAPLPASLSPHRASPRLRPFALPAEDVLRLGRSLPRSLLGSVLSPIVRVTIVELASGAALPEDVQRLATYVTPAKGHVLLGAMRVDVETKTIHANDGLTYGRTSLPLSDEAMRCVAEALGAPLDSPVVPFETFPPLFSTRAIALAGFLLSPVARAGLLAWNYHRTRRTRLALAFFGTAALVLGAAIAISEIVAAITPLVSLGGALFIHRLARLQFGDPPKKASSFFAIAVSIASLIVFVGLVGVPVIGLEMLNEQTVVTENGSKVIHDRNTSDDAARRVGALLQERGVLVGGESGVNLVSTGKGNREHELRVVLPDDHAHEPESVQTFYPKVAADISIEIFGGEKVAFVFQTSYGTELGRVSSR